MKMKKFAGSTERSKNNSFVLIADTREENN